jgi:Tol biopolymer transport system component
MAVRDGMESVYWQAFDGAGTMERLSSGTERQAPASFSPDGAHLIFGTPPPSDLGVISLGATRTTTMLLHSPATEMNGDISPDGRWLAYEIRRIWPKRNLRAAFPHVETARHQVSTGGGTRPVWSRTGRELFYYVEPGTIMAVPMRLGADVTLGNPQPVVTRAYANPINRWRHYDVSADGQRFLLFKDAPTTDGKKAAAPEILVVVNWLEELKAKVPTR